MPEILWNVFGVTMMGCVISIIRKVHGEKIYPQILALYWLVFLSMSLLPLNSIVALSNIIDKFDFISELESISNSRNAEYLELISTQYSRSLLSDNGIKAKFVEICKVVWILGVVFSFSIKSLREINLRRKIKKECKGIYCCIDLEGEITTNVYITEVIGPIVHGIHPHIYVPERFIGNDAMRSILLHEKTHIIRKHHLLLILLDVLSCIYWFIPYYEHVFLRFLREDMEYRCDYEVIKTSGINPKEYAWHYAYVHGCRSGLNILLNFGEGKFMKRICRMLNSKKNRRQTLWTAILLGIIVSVCAVWVSCVCVFQDANGLTKWEVSQAKKRIISILNMANEKNEQGVLDYIYEEGPLSGVDDFVELQYNLYDIQYLPSTSAYYENKYRKQHHLTIDKFIHLMGKVEIEGSEMIWGFSLVFDKENDEWKLYDWGQ